MKDILIIGAACAAALLLGGWLYFSGGNSISGGGTVSMIVLDEGMDSGAVTSRTNYRIKNQEELEALWNMVHGTGAPTTVDFSKKEIIAVFDGTHVTGGYEVAITSVVEVEGTRTVSIVRTEPGENCVTTEAISSPFQIVVVDKSAVPYAHEEETVVRECQ
jgi:hypothetical protein